MRRQFYQLIIAGIVVLSSCKKAQQVVDLSPGLIGKWTLVETMISPGNSVPWTKVPNGKNSLLLFKKDSTFSGTFSNSGSFHTTNSSTIQLISPDQTKSVYYYSLHSDTLITFGSTCIEACGFKFLKVK